MRKVKENQLVKVLRGLDREECITALRMVYERIEDIESGELAKMGLSSEN